ncbi:MAG: sortase [Clostridia bacterium]|nr:sortase [Clostridia bacterium]
MKKFLIVLAILLVIAAGVGYLVYPVVSNQVAKGNDAALIRDYHKTVKAMDSAAINEELQKAVTYNNELNEGEDKKFEVGNPFAASINPGTHYYESILSFSNGIIGEMGIPAISVALPIYHSTMANRGTNTLVHQETTHLPTGTGGTQTVLAGPGIQPAEGFFGQIGLTDERMLEDLDRVIPGNLIYLNILDRTFAYLVDDVKNLSTSGLASLDLSPVEGEDRLTVMTEKKGHLVLVQARRVAVSDIQELLEHQDQGTIPPSWEIIMILGLPVLLLGFVILAIIGRIKRRKYMLPTEGRDKKKQEPVFPEDGDEPKPTDDKNKETEATAAETDGTEGKRD